MSITFEFTAEPRSDLGKGASRRLRRAGQVPAILYGGGQDPLPLTLNHLNFVTQLQNPAVYSHVLTLKIGDQIETAVLRDLQRHPFKPTILHIDFLLAAPAVRTHRHRIGRKLLKREHADIALEIRHDDLRDIKLRHDLAAGATRHKRLLGIGGLFQPHRARHAHGLGGSASPGKPRCALSQ